MCQTPLNESCQIDHIVRRSDGGTDKRENLQALCAYCHDQKTRAENAANPIGALARLARERHKTMKRKIDDMLARETQQKWKTESIGNLLTWIDKGRLVPARFNRTPVWSARAQKEFITLILNNSITAPFYFACFSDTARMDIYDGINRLDALKRFVNGEFSVCIDGEQLFFTKPSSAAGYEMSQDQRDRFLFVDLQLGLWHNIDEAEACEMARKLNSGTPANIGERLLWTTGMATPRCTMLTRLRQTEHGSWFMNKRDRLMLFPWLAEVFMRTADRSLGNVGARILGSETLEKWLMSDAVIQDEVRAFQDCQTLLQRVRHFLSYESAEGTSFNISQLQLVTAVMQRDSSFQPTSASYRAWLDVCRERRIVCAIDFHQAVDLIIATGAPLASSANAEEGLDERSFGTLGTLGTLGTDRTVGPVKTIGTDKTIEPISVEAVVPSQEAGVAHERSKSPREWHRSE